MAIRIRFSLSLSLWAPLVVTLIMILHPASLPASLLDSCLCYSPPELARSINMDSALYDTRDRGVERERRWIRKYIHLTFYTTIGWCAMGDLD